QWRRNDSVKNSCPAAQYHVPLATNVVCETGARIYVIRVCVHRAGWPSLPLVAQTIVQREPVCGAPLIHEVETVVGVSKFSFGLIPYRVRNLGALIDRSIDRRLLEVA